jgi:thiol-disulfide isomerase/thioredoxin
MRKIIAALALLVSFWSCQAQETEFSKKTLETKFKDKDNKEIKFSQILDKYKGKTIFIEVWASWCPDCRKENPNIVAAWNKFKDKNFTILGVSLDRKKEPWLAAIEKDQLTWTHVSDLKDWKSDAAVQYAIRWIPMNFLLDPNGVILAVGLEGEALQQKLEEVLK